MRARPVARPGPEMNTMHSVFFTVPFFVAATATVAGQADATVYDGLVLPVESGRIGPAAGEPLAGMPVGEALRMLEQWRHDRR